MTDPRRASVKFLALLTLTFLVAALPLKHAAQSASAKQQQQSPNGRISYHSDQAGDPGVNDIYTMDADGKHETRLTNNAADDARPVWSPQGDNIAFISDRRDGYEIYLMNADGSNQRPLRAADPVRAFDAEWSPDGTRLAYSDGGDIYVVEVTSGGGGDSTAPPLNVSAGRLDGSNDIEVSWSPDGGRLVIRNDNTNCPTGGCTNLFTVNSDGSGRAALVTAAGFDTHPRWSPDGNFIAYVANRGESALYVIDSEGLGSEQMLSPVGSLGAPAWSPDGLRLAFTSVSGRLGVVNRDGTGLATLTDMADTCSDPFWSPDGQKVAFQNGGDVHVVNVDGSNRRPANYTKTKRAAEAASSWQKMTNQ